MPDVLLDFVAEVGGGEQTHFALEQPNVLEVKVTLRRDRRALGLPFIDNVGCDPDTSGHVSDV
jgi:hypothetical protein